MMIHSCLCSLSSFAWNACPKAASGRASSSRLPVQLHLKYRTDLPYTLSPYLSISLHTPHYLHTICTSLHIPPYSTLSPHYLHISLCFAVSFVILYACFFNCLDTVSGSTQFNHIETKYAICGYFHSFESSTEWCACAPVSTDRMTGQIPMPPQYVTLAAQGFEKLKFDSERSW